MLELKGKDLIRQTEEPVNYGITQQDKQLVFKYKTRYGDEVTMYFTSAKKDTYAQLAEKLWTTAIVDYTLLDNEIIYLPPAIYWNIYKKIVNGQAFLKGTGSSLFINNKPYSFPTTHFYFNPQEDAYTKGVYGIYDGDRLLYIGSASDIERTWKSHDAKFRGDEPVAASSMYTVGYNADELTYRVLEDEQSLMPIVLEKQISMWLFELIAYVYAKALKPIYNFSRTASFKASKGDLPLSYYNILMNLLTDDAKTVLFKHEDILEETE